MILGFGRRQGVGMGRGATIARLAIAVALLSGALPSSVPAQVTMSESLAARVKSGEGKDRLLVEAKEIVYDNDRNTVSASGDVELYFQGRTLQADRVVYDRNTGRVVAEGNARMSEATGAVITGARFELTEDFKSGFIDSLRVEQTIVERGRPAKTYFTSPRAERLEGDQTVFERGTYTACEPCKEHPERPPLWQVKAARIIHNESEKTIYYENATLEFIGIPVAYMPYFWTPDPTVKRKTGFLAPHYVSSTALGFGAAVPFFWNIAPNYDLTVQPTFLSRQGVLGQAEWRHRLLTGSYNIRVAGIFQKETSAFLDGPIGAGDRNFRGSIESAGSFRINERWKWGWDIALMTDKWFFQNYHIKSESLNSVYFKESISTLYLTGVGDRSFFDVRGYYFKGLSSFDWQKQQPVVHPVLDYDKRIDGPRPIGGEVAFNLNFTSLTREAAHFQQIPTRNLGLFPGTPYFGLYDTCTVFERGQCLVRGLSGTFTRLSTDLTWRRNYVDSFGQVWTPFAFLRTDGFFNAPDTFGFQNSAISNFVKGEDNFVGRAMPGVGAEYRFPLVAANTGWGTHVIEPIAQIIARPSESGIRRLPNEDSQSLVLDDTTLFDWNKFSGYDRVEGGVRANYGLQYTMTAANGFYANALFGQSRQLAGVNSFKAGDIAETGRASGLETDASDYVGRVQVQPNTNVTFTTRARLDQENLSLKRLEVVASASLNPVLPMTAAITYARVAPQPEIGSNLQREGLIATTSYSISPRWTVSASSLFALDRDLPFKDAFVTNYTAAYNNYLAAVAQNPALQFEAPPYRRPDPWAPVSTGLSIAYVDECTTFSLSYARGLKQESLAVGERERAQTVLFRLEFRTLGEVSYRQNLGAQSPTNATEGSTGN